MDKKNRAAAAGTACATRRARPRKMQISSSHLILLLAGLLSAPVLAQSGQWLLMSRHGECTDVGRALRHKFHDIPSINGPDEFAAEMKRRGFAAKVTNAYDGNSKVVLIEVPDQEISMIFVRKELCQQQTPGPR
jgi:hypothetical protein